jgi:hypothetical protein
MPIKSLEDQLQDILIGIVTLTSLMMAAIMMLITMMIAENNNVGSPNCT